MDLKTLIFQQTERRMEPAECPEFPALDGQVFNGWLTDREWIEYIHELPERPQDDELQHTRLLVFTLRDKDGKRIFETDAQQMSTLANLPAVVIHRWAMQAQRLNGLGAASEDLAKKSAGAPNSASSATSDGTSESPASNG